MGALDLAQALADAGEHHRAGRSDAAEGGYRAVLDAAPEHPAALHGLGILRQQAGLVDEAIDLLRRAADQLPGDAAAQHNLAAALGERGRLNEAIAHYHRALTIAPNYALAWRNVALAQQRQARLEEAIEACRRAVALDPSLRGAHSNLLFLLTHSGAHQPAEVAAEHRRWAFQHADHLGPATWQDDGRDRDRDRRLRVGYVSPDFREHAVAFFIEPLLRAHDRAAVEVVCYANVERPDAVSERLRGLADQWCDIWDEPDERVAAQIREDRIDVLVDLAGHTLHNRLLLFARRPAPVQLSYLGYANTTGLAAIGYRFSDAVADPEGPADELHSEELVRLPRCFLCYQPPRTAPDAASRTTDGSGAVTFGSLNKALKITPEVTALWARLLGELPGSRLLLKSDAFSDPTVREAFAARVAEHGVAAERLKLLPADETMETHLARYGEIDIALDPFPYNGATTTCEALWMGVPVVALAGATHAARVSASLLQAAGLPQLVAESEPGYVAIARELARDRERLAALRGSLRERVRSSPLCDAEGAARAIEAAYRALWRRFREGAHQAKAPLQPERAR